MNGLLRSIAFGAALPILGMVLLLVLTLAPWVLVAFGVVLAIVWPVHVQWLHAQRARAGEGAFGASEGRVPVAVPVSRTQRDGSEIANPIEIGAIAARERRFGDD